MMSFGLREVIRGKIDLPANMVTVVIMMKKIELI